MSTARIDPPGDYRLQQSIEFLSGFAPQPVGPADDSPGELRFTTPLPPSWEPVAVSVAQPEEGYLDVRWTGAGTADDIARHLRRILSLDVDATGFDDIVTADPVLGEVVDRQAGIRPPLFWSPYEAAVWAVLSQRVQMAQAASIKTRLAAEHGTRPGFPPATPGPQQLLGVGAIDGLGDAKLRRLHAVAQAALDGTLDADRLRGASPAEALRALEDIHGIGPFSAELILVRGAGAPDVFPAHERRLHATMRDLYGKPEATSAELARIADDWKPFRSWIAFQFRRSGENQTRPTRRRGGAR